MTVVYSYAKCGTCRKALRWLEDGGVDVKVVPIVESPPQKAELKRLWKRSGLPIRRFFNTSGQSYRQGGFKDRLSTMSDDEALEALAADGKLIKRPLVVSEQAVLVGFREPDYEEAFGATS
ncbi:MAG: arsenate reductase family protein [Myxococcota bacterium]